jgi:hypothetical protein
MRRYSGYPFAGGLNGDDPAPEFDFEDGEQPDAPLQIVAAMRGRLTTVADMVRFVEAGHATLTLVSKASGVRFTFRFSRPEATEQERAAGLKPLRMRCIWVSVLAGQDNESAYSFIGTVQPQRSTTTINPSAKSKVSMDAPSAVAVRWFLAQLYGDGRMQQRLLDQMEVWHEGRCGRCGRKLTVPASIASGFGPECIQLMSGES